MGVLLCRYWTVFLLSLGIAGLCAGCGKVTPEERDLHERYDYRDTRRIVRILLEAEAQLKEEGAAAFESFETDRKRWYYKDAYLYAYTTNGTCIFHGGIPELVGQALPDVVDAEGRELLTMASAAAADPDNVHGWIHYWWNIPNRLYPAWKSSCNRIVTLPDGTQVLLGIGMVELPREREFVKSAVEGAADLLESEGRAALTTLKNPLSRYNLLGSPLFIVTEKGDTVIAPTFRTGYTRNILEYEDDAGHTPLKQAITRLADADSTWVILLTRDPLSMNLHKMGLYMKKVNMGDETLYVGATAPLPKPSWMK